MSTADNFYTFMESHKLCVISTIASNGKPEAALIGFGQTPELEIIFGTDKSTRKYRNIKNNPHVAIVIGWDDKQTLQFEGEARELPREKLNIVREYYWNKSPESVKFSKNQGERYFIVTPAWIRYSDFNLDPVKIEERQFHTGQ